MRRLSLPVLLGALALVASGCMWGVVRDADTGAPLAGVNVTYTDSYGQTASTTTDANGLFGFGAPASVAAARGTVTFQAGAPGYESINSVRFADYAENPGATLSNPTSFWEVQNFTLLSAPILYHNDQGGFSIRLPKSWDVNDDFFGEGTVMAVPPTGNPYHPADISVGSTDRPAGMALGAWVDDTLAGVCSVTADCQNLEREDTTVDGISAIRIVESYTVTAEDPAPGLYANGEQLQEMAYFLKKGNTGYILDFTATAANFPGLRSAFEYIGRSFQFDK
jgi:hypothetical protein